MQKVMRSCILLLWVFLLYTVFIMQQQQQGNIKHMHKKNIGGRKLMMDANNIAQSRRFLIADLEVQYNFNDDDHHHHHEEKHEKTLKSKEDETQRYLRAVDEIANLMHRDYTGKGKGKRNAPINNHIPND